MESTCRKVRISAGSRKQRAALVFWNISRHVWSALEGWCLYHMDQKDQDEPRMGVPECPVRTDNGGLGANSHNRVRIL